jgi:phospholipase C
MRSLRRPVQAVALACMAAAGGASCSAIPKDTSLPPPGASFADANAGTARKIEHVVIVIQENRSYDNLFATFPHGDGTTKGLTHTGKWITLVKAPELAGSELNHVRSGFVKSFDNGKMDGFDTIGYGSTGQQGPAGTYPYRYVDPAAIAPYWKMAREYVLADHMFPTQGSGSFTAHQDLIAGGTAIGPNESVVDFPNNGPWGCDAPSGTHTSLITREKQYLTNAGPFPCFDYPTIANGLDRHRVTWKYYSPPVLESSSTGFLWNAFDAIRKIRYGPDWKANVTQDERRIFSDIRSRRLPGVSWVIPDDENSDHAAFSDTGPSWVTSIVNAVGESPYWNSTAIVVVWDDWGGYYDHVRPPQLSYDGLGIRVPMLVISPYARVGYVSHTQYEFGSILRFVEDNWGLGRLGTSDSRARSIVDCFDFERSPRKFVPIAAKYSRAYFERQKPSNLPVDDE